MSQKASKFLIGGVRFRHNFFGGNTVITGIYGGIEHVGKVAPLFLGIYAIKAATARYVPERDELFDETQNSFNQDDLRRKSFA